MRSIFLISLLSISLLYPKYIDQNINFELVRVKRLKLSSKFSYGDLLFLIRLRDSFEVGFEVNRAIYCYIPALTSFQSIVDCTTFINMSCYFDMGTTPETQSTHPYISLYFSYPI